MPESEDNALVWKPAPLPRPVTLRGRYVTLEPLDAARHSAALWEAVRGRDELWTWLAQGPYPSAAAMMDGLDKWQAANSAVLLAIVPVKTGQAAGWASYMRIDPAHGAIEVGNVMFSPTLQRTREATEAMYLMARHVFEDLGYRRYEWKCNAENEPSRRAAVRLGFTFEGIFRQHMVVKGRNRDTAWFAMLDKEWPARKRAFEEWLEPGNFDGEGRQRRQLSAAGA
jgi:RimJ/RimL family protein N-acetyltransferase